MLLNLLKVLCLSSVYLAQVHSQECLQPLSEAGLPLFMDYTNNNNGYPTIRFRQQAIIPTYELVCCGNITEWGVDIHPVTGTEPVVYSLDLQVWRPSPTVDDSTGTGCYSLVGNNRFTSISLGVPTFILTPSPEAYIEFQPGDVLGFYVEEARNNNFDGIVILNREEFSNEFVWHASIAPTMATSQNGDCPYSVGLQGVLNSIARAAPVISVNITSYSCPLSTEPKDESKSSVGIAVGVAVPLVLIIAITVTIVVSLMVCQVKRAKNNTAKPSNIYADPLHGLDLNEAYEANVITKGNVAYASNRDWEENKVYPSRSNMDVEQNDNYASTEDLLDSAQSEEAYASIVELQPYATVNNITKGNGAAYGENIKTTEEYGENNSYGGTIVREENDTSKPESSSGAVNEYAEYDSI